METRPGPHRLVGTCGMMYHHGFCQLGRYTRSATEEKPDGGGNCNDVGFDGVHE